MHVVNIAFKSQKPFPSSVQQIPLYSCFNLQTYFYLQCLWYFLRVSLLRVHIDKCEPLTWILFSRKVSFHLRTSNCHVKEVFVNISLRSQSHHATPTKRVYVRVAITTNKSSLRLHRIRYFSGWSFLQFLVKISIRDLTYITHLQVQPLLNEVTIYSKF